MKKNIKYGLLSVLSGLLLAFSFPNIIENTLLVHTSFFMWFAFVPIIYVVIKAEKVSDVFWFGLISTGIFYLVSLYWICSVGPMGLGAYPACFVFCLYLASFYAVSFVIVKFLNKKTGLDYILSIPVIITIAEYVRGWLFTGWPGLTPAQSQNQFILALQILSITGVHGLNFIIISVNCVIASFCAGWVFNYKKSENVIWSLVFVFLLVLMIASNMYINTGTKIVKVAILQPNIDQNVPWTPKYHKDTMDMMKELYGMTAKKNPDLVIWPETGYPGILNMEIKGKPELTDWIKGAYSLVGSDKAVIKNGKPEYYNAAFMIDPYGKITGEYSKHHLVPFGEYIPLQETIPFVKKVVQRYGYVGFNSGTIIDPFEFDGVRVGPIICFDSFFPEISREHAKKGAKILAHLSYETWYGVSPASAQVFTNVVLRAVENRVYVARCVASGISGIVNDKGVILASTKLFEKKAFVYELKISDDKRLSFYTMYGDWFIWLLFAAFCAAAVVNLRKK